MIRVHHRFEQSADRQVRTRQELRSRGLGDPRSARRWRVSSRLNVWLAAGFLTLCSTGCRTPAPLPRLDLSAPGWEVQHGQAVWTPRRNEREITGELLLARHTNGDCLVQFTKPPFAIVEARTTGQHWRLEFGAGEKVWRGRGQPAARVAWFQLPRVQAGGELDARWSWRQADDGAWSLTNHRTGERLEGRFFK